MPPAWLSILAWIWIWIAVSVASAGAILADTYLHGYRQHMWIMQAVWPVTALYFGLLALPAISDGAAR